jgi:hypothetical protein
MFILFAAHEEGECGVEGVHLSCYVIVSTPTFAWHLRELHPCAVVLSSMWPLYGTMDLYEAGRVI